MRPNSTNNATQISLTVDGRNYSTVVNSLLTQGDYSWMTFLGSTDLISYEMAFDELYIWKRLLDTSEKRLLYSNGSGYFYPFAPTSSLSYRIVSGVTVNDGGLSYVVAPSVTIAAPTGNGAAATAYSILGPDTGRIYADSWPAFSVGTTNSIVTNMMSGSGSFVQGNNDFLRVGNLLHFNDWTVFLDMTPTGNRPTGVSQILISTMDSVNQTSGLMFGINDANRLFFEYIDTTNPSLGQRRVYVQNLELSENNIISLSADSVHKTMTVCNHTMAKQSTFGASFYTPGYTPSNKMFLGGFTNSGNNIKYSGFYGLFKDVLILSGAANAVQMNSIAPLFCLTGYVPESQVPIYSYYSIVTGAEFIEMVVATGTTGYSLDAVNIPDKDGIDIPVYSLSSLAGPISGTGIYYASGNSSGVLVSFSGVDEILYFDNTYLKQYADSNFVMLRYPISSGDLVEVFSFDEKLLNKISVMPDAFNLYDFYLSSEFNSDNANVYHNGLLQVTGIDYTLTSGKILSSLYSQYLSAYDFLLYDEISGATLTHDWTGWSGTYNLGGDVTSGGARGIYLNGQKLTSGVDYTFDGVDIILTNNVWSSGTWAYAPNRTGNMDYFTGTNLGFWHNFAPTSIGRLMDEMIYANGQRLAPGIDYITVSSASLLNTDFRPATFSAFSIYSGNDTFGTGVTALRPNIAAPINNPVVPTYPPAPHQPFDQS